MNNVTLVKHRKLKIIYQTVTINTIIQITVFPRQNTVETFTGAKFFSLNIQEDVQIKYTI